MGGTHLGANVKRPISPLPMGKPLPYKEIAPDGTESPYEAMTPLWGMSMRRGRETPLRRLQRAQIIVVKALRHKG